MSKKKTILHFIYSLGRGGAEVMLINAIKELPEFRHEIVTMIDDNRFENELICDDYISMNLKSINKIPKGIYILKKIIRRKHIDLVHSHLFYPTIIARCAVPKFIPLVTTIHSFINMNPDYNKWYIKLPEKITYRIRPSVIIGVSEGVRKNYFSYLKLKPGSSYTLYNFAGQTNGDHFSEPLLDSGAFKIISVGSLKSQKNFEYLIRSFRYLKSENIELHIYGEGSLREKLQKLIDNYQVNIILKGEIKNIKEVLPAYHAFTLSSTFEGFSLAVLEAMSAKLPLVLSDIASFKEQCGNSSLYFDLQDDKSFAEQIVILRDNARAAQILGEAGFKRVEENFTLTHHITGLRKVYADSLKLRK